jgi:REP element-mobilizing transposase RayT
MWTQRRLPRLDEAHYIGPAYVFWTHVVKDRATGWLNTSFHSHFREVLLHTLSRYHIGCPIYMLMPDHIHLIWIGAHTASNQLLANRFLRRYLQLPLQKQAYDHIIRENERTGSQFPDICNYIRQNPARANLISTAGDWPYQAAMIPGYPCLSTDTIETFWKCFHAYQQSLIPAP